MTSFDISLDSMILAPMLYEMNGYYAVITGSPGHLMIKKTVGFVLLQAFPLFLVAYDSREIAIIVTM